MNADGRRHSSTKSEAAGPSSAFVNLPERRPGQNGQFWGFSSIFFGQKSKTRFPNQPNSIRITQSSDFSAVLGSFLVVGDGLGPALAVTLPSEQRVFVPFGNTAPTDGRKKMVQKTARGSGRHYISCLP